MALRYSCERAVEETNYKATTKPEWKLSFPDYYEALKQKEINLIRVMSKLSFNLFLSLAYVIASTARSIVKVVYNVFFAGFCLF